MMRLISLATSVLLATTPVWAEPYWYAYEGNDFPENEGWTRVHGDKPAERWIDDGVFFIDGRAEVGIYDFYEMVFDGGFDPGPGETFVMRWRLKVDEVDGFEDPTVRVRSDRVAEDQFYAVGFTFTEDLIRSAYEPDVEAPIEPHVFHEYELRSQDMRNYRLYVDDDALLQGGFCGVFGPTAVAWGDGASARGSAEWDYVRFGVVPEPKGLALGLFTLAGMLGCRSIWVDNRSCKNEVDRKRWYRSKRR
jgi:hypothetical protein